MFGFFYRRGFRAECFCFSVCSRGKNASEPQDVSVGGLILSQITSFGMKERGSSVTVSQGSLYDWKDTIKAIFYYISNKRCLTPWAPLSDPG